MKSFLLNLLANVHLLVILAFVLVGMGVAVGLGLLSASAGHGCFQRRQGHNQALGK